MCGVVVLPGRERAAAAGNLRYRGRGRIVPPQSYAASNSGAAALLSISTNIVVIVIYLWLPRWGAVEATTAALY